MRKIWAVFHARNLEFVRDRSSLGWNFLFPFLIVIGFAFMFNSGERPLYKVAELHHLPETMKTAEALQFSKTRFLEFIKFESEEKALNRLAHHKVDFVVSYTQPPKYWVSETSPNSYVVEQMFLASLNPKPPGVQKKSIKGQEVRYVDWLMAGILGMNIMFSALFGVGYVIVRYRKNGVLKRLKATPLRPWEFLTAQVFSRLVLNIVTVAIVLIGCSFAVDFLMLGSYFDLFVVVTLGTMSLISVGMLIAARFASEELAGGLLNMLSWPMMFLSGVWFSLEGANEWVLRIANIFPLTHMIDAMRAIMTEGVGLVSLGPELLYMLLATVVCMTASSLIFKWE